VSQFSFLFLPSLASSHFPTHLREAHTRCPVLLDNMAPGGQHTEGRGQPYGKSRSQKPAYSYRELCRFPKVWDAPQGPSGDPIIPKKTGISETMTGV